MGLSDQSGNLDYSKYVCNVYIGGILLPTSHQIISLQIKKALQYISSAEIMIKQDLNIEKLEVEGILFSDTIADQSVTIKAIFEMNEIILFEGFLVKRHFKSSVTGNRLQLIAKSKIVNMAMNTTTEIFTSISDKEIIELICQNNGFNTKFDSTIDGKLDTKYTQCVKHRISDWDYINQRAEKNSCYIYTENQEVIIISPTLDQKTNSVTASYGLNVFELEFDEDQRLQNIKNAISTFDLAQLEPNSIVSDRNSYDASLSIKGEENFINYKIFNEIESGNLLDSYDHLQDFSGVNGLVHIYADFTPKCGDLINFNGFGDLDSKQLLISAVMHDYSEGGFSTYIQFGLDHKTFQNKYLSRSSATLKPFTISGIVQAIEDDPDNLNRIQIKIPLWKDTQEGLWARHSTLYAGSDYGLILLPEIGDEVLVSFIGDDLDSPVILGSIFSPKFPPFENSDDSNSIKCLITKKGMKWSWDDEKGIHEISTASGNKIIVSEDDKSIIITDENGNEIELKNGSVKIESQKDLQIKAANKITMEATTIDIIASGITKVKGSLIKIN